MAITPTRSQAVFPAPAGMNQAIDAKIEAKGSVPRTCGDEPAGPLVDGACACVFPAPAGMNLYLALGDLVRRGVPRTCGDEPYASDWMNRKILCSPHLRGSTCRADQIALRDPGDRTLSDARTPLARLHAAARVARRRFPRARRRTRRGPPEHSRPPAVAGSFRCVRPGRPRRPACPAARPADPCPGAAVVRRWRWHRACPGYGPAHE